MAIATQRSHKVKHGCSNSTSNLDCVTKHQLSIAAGGNSLDLKILIVQINGYCLAAVQNGDALCKDGGDRPLGHDQ